MQLKQIYIFRFIAAIAVVIYHFGLSNFLDFPIVFKLFSRGNEAVNFFFFLSGFIMVIAYQKELSNNGFINRTKYYLKRIARLYPVYILALLITVIYNYRHPIINVSAVRLGIESLLLQSWIGKTSINFPGWSLSVEILFYLIFPFIFKYLFNLKVKYVIILSCLIYLLTVISGSLLIVEKPNKTFFFEYFPFLHMGTFVNGTILGIFFIKNYSGLLKQSRYYKRLFYLIMLSLIFILSLINIPHHNNGWLIPIYGCFVIAVSLPSKATNLLTNDLFITLGDISYSIYILQYPVWLYFKTLIPQANLFSFFIYLILLILFSYLVYRFFEVPLRKYINDISNKKRRLIIT